MELPFKIYIFFYKPFASTKQKHLLNSNIWNKFQTSNYLSFLRNFLSNFYFFCKPFASTKQKHLLNSNVWNKFQTSNYLSFLRNFLSNFYFFCKPFASTKQKHLLNSNVWNKFQILKIYRSYGTSFQIFIFSANLLLLRSKNIF